MLNWQNLLALSEALLKQQLFQGGPQPLHIAVALFSFPNLAAYEEYRNEMWKDPECQAAFKFAEETRCIISYQRSFMKPILE